MIVAFRKSEMVATSCGHAHTAPLADAGASGRARERVHESAGGREGSGGSRNSRNSRRQEQPNNNSNSSNNNGNNNNNNSNNDCRCGGDG